MASLKIPDLSPSVPGASPKPGYQTTEFWITLLVGLPSLLVMAGVIPTQDAGMLGDAASKIGSGLIAGMTVWKYIHSRMAVKTQA